MSEPQRPKRRTTPVEPGHWYSTSTPTPLVDLDRSERRGSARDRIERRRTSAPPPAPQVRPPHLVIGAAIVGILAMITLTLFAASRAGSGGGTSATATPMRSVGLPTGTATLALNVQPWDGKGRLTVLVMGIDQRPDESVGGAHTDLMLLLSIDPVTKAAGMLSIPRDLYMPIPGESDMQRINSAYLLGELKKPGSGPQLVMQTLQYNLGIKVNNYVLLNFQTVIALIDAVGGVDIDVATPIDDEEYPDMNYGFDPLHIPAGHIHMDGALALKYARTRHQTSDYDRTHRQQQVILAVREKVVKLNMLPQLVQQAPGLWTQLQGGFETDLSLDQILRLAVYARDIPFASIKHGTIEDQYALAVQHNGEVIVTHNRGNIQELMTQIFGGDYAK